MRAIPTGIMATPAIQAKFPDGLDEEVREVVGLAGILVRVVGVVDSKMIGGWFDDSMLDDVIVLVVEVPVGIS
jgi:hypothetical protein